MSGAYQELRVWKQAMDLAEAVYRRTESFPRHELYGMVSQLRRAAVSIPSNIAEGKGHRSDREFLHYLFHAHGSLYEVETQIGLALRLQYVSGAQGEELSQHISTVARSLTGLINSISEETAVEAVSRRP